jgi:hypothetical protein
MRQAILALALAGVLSAAVGPVALGAQETPIYQGDLKTAPVPVVVGAWGSGSLQEVGEVKLEGASSLKLVSQGDFQGGRIDFTTPLSIATYAGQPDAYIEIWVRPFYERAEAPAPTAATPTPPIAPGGAAAPAPAPAPPTQFRLRFGVSSDEDSGETSPAPSPPFATVTPAPRATQPGVTPPVSGLPGRRGTVSSGRSGTTTTRPGSAAPKAAPAEPPPKPEQAGPASPDTAAFRATGFRVQLITDRGVAVLPAYPVYPGDKKSGAWFRIGFPLRKFDGPVGDRLQSIAIFADRADTVYIGAVKLRLETAPIIAKPAAYPAIARVGQPVTFLANASAGLSPLDIEWDFDNADGVQVQAEGPRVVNVYTRPGYYEATVTVRDATGGAAEPRTQALLVQVK